MSIPVVISGATYDLPQQGQNPPWGDDLSSLILALINIANSSSGPSDILTTNFSLANNVAAPANVTGLFFDPSTVRSAIISYSLYRSTNSNEVSEAGQIIITYSSTAGTWELAQYDVGASGVVFSITNSGQVQYTSSNVIGASYSGKLKFSAKSFLQT